MSSSYGQKQLEVIRDIGKNKFTIHTGCYGCGKTYSIEVALGLLCLKLQKEGIEQLNIVLLGKTQQTVKKNQCNVLSDLFGTNFKYDSGRRDGKTKDAILFGQYIHVVGLNDKSSESKFRGISNIFCIIHDEAIYCTKEQFNAIQSRLRGQFSDEQNRVFDRLNISPCFYIASTNPDSPMHWLKQLIDTGFFDKSVIWTMEDAKWNGAVDYYNKLKKLYPVGSLDYERYILSQWRAADGSIFTTFIGNHSDYIIDNVAENELLYLCVGIDFGGHKSGTSIVISGYHKNRRDGMTVVHSNRLIGTKGEINPDSMNSWIIAQLRICMCKYKVPIRDISCDNAEQYLEQGVRQAVRKAGFNIPVGDALKLKIMDRVKFIQNGFATNMIHISKDCKTLIESLDTLVYDPKAKSDTVLDDGSTDNDSFDAFCYSFEKQMNRFNYI